MIYKKRLWILSALLILLIALFIGMGLTPNNWQYALSRRIPKVVAILLTGGAIAMSSTIFQTITNNRILTPSILGLDSLYLLFQTFAVFIFGSTSPLVINGKLNFVFAVTIMILFSFVLYKLMFKQERNNIFFLLLVGMIFGTLFQSLSSFMQVIIDPNEYLSVQANMYASFNNIKTDILWFVGIVLLVLSVLTYACYHKKLDVVSLGRDEAINLGISYDKLTKQMLIVVVVFISISTALIGPITFLGILVVNLAREFIKTFEHKYLIPASMLISCIALVGGQFIIERIFNYKTPLSVIINLVGGLYFIFLLLKENKE